MPATWAFRIITEQPAAAEHRTAARWNAMSESPCRTRSQPATAASYLLAMELLGATGGCLP